MAAKAKLKTKKLPGVKRLTKTIRDDHYDGYLNPVSNTVIQLCDRGEHNRRKALAEESMIKKEQIFDLYRKGVSREKMAKIVGVGKYTIVGVISHGFAEGNLTEYVVSEDEQRIIDLYNEGKTYPDIAKILGISNGAVSGALYRLRKEGFVGYRKK